MGSMARLFVLAVCAMTASLPVFGAVKGDVAKGKQQFQGMCAVCHNADSDAKKVGPGLKGLFKRDKLVNGKKPTEANVRDKIANGGNGMPAYKDMLSPQQMDDLVAYLKTL
jgi:mono/diheme cytochrome c family protein